MARTLKKKSFIFNVEWQEILLDYPAEVRLEVYDAIIEYVASGTLSELKPMAKMAFSFIKKEIDYNTCKYDDIVSKRSEAGKKAMNKRYNKDVTNLTNDSKSNKCYQDVTNLTVNDNDNDNDNDNVNVNEECPPYNSPQGESAPPESNEGDKINYNALMDTFNRMFDGKLPKVTTMTDKRKKAVKARASEHGKEAIMAVFNNVSKSAFLLGHNNQNWSCDFDWIFRPTNFIKILEGNYNGERISKNQQDSEQRKRDSVLAVATTVREAAAKKRKELEAEGVIE